MERWSTSVLPSSGIDTKNWKRKEKYTILMKIDYALDNLIAGQLKAQNDAEQANHKSSGKLSASMLGQPLQWQILKVLGVQGKKFDDYTLRKFKRGKDVENWVVSFIQGEAQKFVEYRNVVGYVDKIVDTKEWDNSNGLMPLEIKSVTNMKFKRVDKEGADRGHKLQATLYALALGHERFGVCYIASDDYRVKVFVYDTSEMKKEVDEIIDQFNNQLKLKVVPVFEAKEKWQDDLKYNSFPLWAGLSEDELKEKSKNL